MLDFYPPVSHSLYMRAAVCLKTSHLTLVPPGTHLIRSFGGHLIAPIPLFPPPKRQVKSQGCLSWDNLLRECAIFPFQLNYYFFRPAAATPGCLILFDPGRRQTCHEKPYGKSKVHDLIFIARNANVIPTG